MFFLFFLFEKKNWKAATSKKQSVGSPNKYIVPKNIFFGKGNERASNYKRRKLMKNKGTEKATHFVNFHFSTKIPNLIDVQRQSFYQFVENDMKKAFQHPLRFSTTHHHLEILFFPDLIQFQKPEYTQHKAFILGQTYGSAVYIPVAISCKNMTVFEPKHHGVSHHFLSSQDRKSKSVRVEWLFVGILPVMTNAGHFLINGIPRVVLHQLIRNPGVYTLPRDSRTQTATVRIVPQKGGWINLTVDKKNRAWFSTRVLRRKVSLLIFLQALGVSPNEIFNNLQHSEILKNSYVNDLSTTNKHQSIRGNEDFSNQSLDTLFLGKTRHDKILIRAGLEGHPRSQYEAWRYLYAHFIEYSPYARDDSLSEEGIRDFFWKTLWNKETLYLGQIGRQQFREKLGSPELSDQEYLTKEDILAATRALLQLIYKEKLGDEIDSLTQKRIRGCNEFLFEQLLRGIKEFEVFFTRKVNALPIQKGGTHFLEPNPLDRLWRQNKAVFSKAVSKSWKSFFTSGTLAQFMDQTNPLAETTHKRRLTVLGPGGVSSKQTTIQIRGIHPTFYGRLCPIETPEGQNAGLVNSFTVLSTLSKELSGQLHTPFYQVYKGQVQKELPPFIVSAGHEFHLIGTPADIRLNAWNFLPKSSLPVRKDLQFDYAPSNQINTQAVGILQTISVATSLIPFLEHDDANRALMGSNMQRQAVTLVNPEVPIVGTGLETRVICDVNHGRQVSTSGYITKVNSLEMKILTPKNPLYKKSIVCSLFTKIDLAVPAQKTCFLVFKRNFWGAQLVFKTGIKNRFVTNLFFGKGLPKKGPFFGCARTLCSFFVSPPLFSFILPSEQDKKWAKKKNGPKKELERKEIIRRQNKYQQREETKKSTKDRLFRGSPFFHNRQLKGSTQSNGISQSSYLLNTETHWYVSKSNHFFVGKNSILPCIWGVRRERQKFLTSLCILNSFQLRAPLPSFCKKPSLAAQISGHPHLFENIKARKTEFLKNGTERKRCSKEEALGIYTLLYPRRSSIFLDETQKSPRSSFIVNGKQKTHMTFCTKKVSFLASDFLLPSNRFPFQDSAKKTRFLGVNTISKKYDSNHSIVNQLKKQLPPHQGNQQRNEHLLYQSKVYSLTDYQRTNQSTFTKDRPILPETSWIEPGDLVADGAASSRGNLSIGKNVLVAYLPWEGYNFEDAILISQRLVDKDIFTSLHIDHYDIEVKNTQYGLERITKNIPLKIDDSTRDIFKIEKLNSRGLVEIGTWVQEGDYLVGKISPLNPKGPSIERQYEKLYNVIMQREKTNFRNTSLRVPKGVEGFVLDVQILPPQEPDVAALAEKTDILRVRVVLLQRRKIQVGDKIAGRHGNKGIVSKILSYQDMPYLPDGTPVDIVLNPLGVPSRMNVGQILECLLGLAGRYLHESYSTHLFDERFGAEASRSLVYSKLYEAAQKTSNPWLFEPHHPGKIKLFDGRTGLPFDQPITVGCAYILKLVHLVDDKIHARATGPYSAVTQQPVRGRSRNGGQRLGEMEVWALQAYGAAYTLHELLTLKSDDIEGRKQAVIQIYANKSLNSGRPESFKVLLRELQALCFDLQLYATSTKSKFAYKEI
jgi:DNA-directed RNA polymerase subunit beta